MTARFDGKQRAWAAHLAARRQQMEDDAAEVEAGMEAIAADPQLLMDAIQHAHWEDRIDSALRAHHFRLKAQRDQP
jgi:hypothetical protein